MLVAGVGSGLVGGFYLAFSLVVMPALRRRPAAEAASVMQAINEAAVRAPFLVLFFGTAASCLVVVVGAGGSGSGALLRVLGGLASLAGWVLTMAVNVPLNTRLARTDARTADWSGYARPWTRANHLRSGLCALGSAALLLSLS